MNATELHTDVEAIIAKIPAEETKLIAEGKHILATIRADMIHLLDKTGVETWFKSAEEKIDAPKS